MRSVAASSPPRRAERAAAVLLLALLLAGVPAVQAGGLTVLGLQGSVPDAWQPQSPSSRMRLAQALVPPDASFVVYFFGAGQGGSAGLNIDRWRSQFSRADGKPLQPRVERSVVVGMPVTLVELRGDYARGVGMTSAAPTLADHILRAAIVETPRGALFVHLYGPAASVQSARADFDAFVMGLRPVGD